MTKTIAVLFVTLTLAFLALNSPAASQGTESGAAVATSATSQKIQELTSKLSEDELNALARLLELLAADKKTSTALTVKRPGVAATLLSAWQSYRHFVWSNVTGIPHMVSGVAKAVAAMFSERSFSGNLAFIAMLFVTLGIGAAAEFLVTRVTRNWLERSRQTETADLPAMIKALGIRLVLELAGLAAFTILVLELAGFFFGDATDRFLVTRFVLLAIVPVRLIASFLQLMLAPNRPNLRLVSVDDWTARFIYRNLVFITGVVGVGLFLFGVMNRFNIPGGELLRFWVGLYVYLGLFYVTWRARKGLTSIIKGEDEYLTPGLERMAVWWPGISIFAMLMQYLASQIALSTGAYNFSPGTGAIIIALIVLAPFLDTMLRGVIKHLVPPMQGEGPVAEAAYRRTRYSYARIGRIVLLAILILTIFRLWGISFHNLAAAGVGIQFAAKLLSSIIVLVVGYLVWELANLWINRQIAGDVQVADIGDHGEAEGGGAGNSRVATVLPLLRITLLTTIVTITILLALSQLGLNITPLLAGAGVFGLAIGFGAQTLVKDVVSGVFFLLDDAFRLGEFIDIGGTMGTVEKISVRSLQLRHPNGPVHIIPYGEISKLTNNSRDYVIMKLRFTVPFDTNIEKVRKIFKKIGQEMMDDPEIGRDFIQPFKSQGVADVDDVGIVVRGKFMTKPGAQWVIRKQVYARVQKAFEENGIQFARKEVRVQIPNLDERGKLTSKQMEGITKAASSAAIAAAEKPTASKTKKQDDPF